MKITINQLRKIIKEELKKISDYKKDGWPECDCGGEMKPNPQMGKKTSLYCSDCGKEKKNAVKLEG